jgi:hypothetical protein
MAAPGENSEFREGAYFKSKVVDRKELQEAVLSAIKNHPRQGKPVVGPAWEMDFVHAGQVWTVLYSLKRTDVGLLNVFGPGEEGRLKAYKEDLCELFKGSER